MPKEELTYEKAYAELQQIQSLIEMNEVPIDQLAEKVKRARQLLEFCRNKLRDVEKQISEEHEE